MPFLLFPPPLIPAPYFISSELSMVMVLPSILMATFSSNSERQRRSENFWIPKYPPFPGG